METANYWFFIFINQGHNNTDGDYMKKIGLFLILFLMPIYTFAYSDYIYLGGNTLGIEVNCDGILVVGFYQINGKYNKGDLKVGDYIKEVNGVSVDTLNDLTKEIEKYTSEEYVNLTYTRDNKEYTSKLNLINDDGIYKTGLFVKDSIVGIGTLTYIDPGTKIYGALGHEIVESNTKSIVEIRDGSIFRNQITSIDKSEVGSAGSKNAKYYYNTVYGTIFKNTFHGIFGKYTDLIESDLELVKVAQNEEVKVGPATIYTVLEKEKVEEFTINITKINETSNTKNITFEITDKDLIEKTGGVVQGMSGSPIMQNGMIVGVVTHVIVDNPLSGYGLFITKMLEEGEN